MYLSLLLGFLLFPKFLKYWKLTQIKNLIFNHKISMSRIMVFWSDHEIKTPRKLVFRLNREIKCRELQKSFKKPAKLKCHENFLP